MHISGQAIEGVVERKIDRLDAEYLSTNMTKDEYDKRCDEIKEWADEQYKKLREKSN